MHGPSISDLENDLWPTFLDHEYKKLFFNKIFNFQIVFILRKINGPQFNLVMHGQGNG
jgi:hypothetical protein